MVVVSRFNPRELIFHELNKTYLKENGSDGITWYCRGTLGTDLNKAVTINILNHLALLYCLEKNSDNYRYYFENARQEITNIIWAAWPGGTTAANAADRVISALELDLE